MASEVRKIKGIPEGETVNLKEGSPEFEKARDIVIGRADKWLEERKKTIDYNYAYECGTVKPNV